MAGRLVGQAVADRVLPVSGSVSLQGLRLTSYTVLHDGVSVHLRGEILRQEISELLDRIVQVTHGRYYVPGSLAISGETVGGAVQSRFSVASVTSRRGAAMLLLRAPKERSLVVALLGLVGDAELTLQMGIPQTLGTGPKDAENGMRAAVQALLEEIARRRRMDTGALLEQLTAFVGKGGKHVPGKRALAEVSAKQLPVVRDRLLRMREDPRLAGHGSGAVR